MDCHFEYFFYGNVSYIRIVLKTMNSVELFGISAV